MPGRGLHPPTQDRGAGGGPRMEEMCAPHPATQRAGQRGAGGARLRPPRAPWVQQSAGQTTVNHRPRRLFPKGNGCRPVRLSQPDGCHCAEPVRFRNLGEEGISRGDQAHGPQAPAFRVPLAALSAPRTHSPLGTNKLPPRKLRTPGNVWCLCGNDRHFISSSSFVTCVGSRLKLMNFSCQREPGSKIGLVLPNSVNEVSLQRKKK